MVVDHQNGGGRSTLTRRNQVSYFCYALSDISFWARYLGWHTESRIEVRYRRDGGILDQLAVGVKLVRLPLLR